jgi:hypothetical protein
MPSEDATNCSGRTRLAFSLNWQLVPLQLPLIECLRLAFRFSVGASVAYIHLPSSASRRLIIHGRDIHTMGES